MRIIRLSDDVFRPLPTVATIGFFDGVHRGHRYLIQRVIETARREQLLSTVVTFERHPRQVLSTDWHPQLLTTLDEKAALLAATGVDQLVVLTFDAEMAALSAYDFMRDVLQKRLDVKVLLTGYDNHFGHRTKDSREGFDDYVEYGRRLGMRVVQGAPQMVGDVRVSSSKVRQMLQAGDVALAARCLGRPYELTGTVVGGEHVGTELGFPTANLQPTDGEKLVPAAGVYAVRVRVGVAQTGRLGMMNIGSRPTFSGDHQTLETHIFDFHDNLYGQPLTVQFVERLRSEQKFVSREALTAQLEADARQSLEILNR